MPKPAFMPIAIVSLSLIAVAPVRAQAPAETQQPQERASSEQCRSELQKLCPDMKRSREAIQQCARDNAEKLSASCRAGDASARASDAFAGDGVGAWNGSIGLGVGVVPLYAGSAETAVTAMPTVRLNWRDRIEIGTDGVSALFSNPPSLRWGVGLTFDRGRDENGDSFLGSTDTDGRLLGMGDIDIAPGLRIFGSKRVGPVALHGSVSKFFAGEDELAPQNDGALLQLGASMPLLQQDRWRLGVRLDATLADAAYMQAYFGVTPTQAGRTTFSPYTPDAGLKDVTIGLNGAWQLSDRWFLTGNAGVTRLFGDAADSPITEEDTGMSLSMGLGYRF